MSWPENCQWCGEPASERIRVGQRGARAVYAYACRDHADKLLPASADPPKEEPVAEERVEPLCRDCFAEITWISLPRNGKRMRIDRRALGIKEPRRSLVLVDVKGAKGVVLKQADVDSGAAAKRIAAGARLHTSHSATCSAKPRKRSAAKAAA